MKRIDWGRVHEIEFSAKKVIKDNPGTAQQTAAQSMVFLCEVIQTLDCQKNTLLERCRKITEGIEQSSSGSAGGEK